MSDLISRQAAKDAVDMALDMMDHVPQWVFSDLLNALDKVPSAEPERKIELHGDESAVEILSELRSWFSCFDEKEGLAYHALSLAIRAIKANSTAEPERKGKWMRLNDIDGFVRCSNCGTFWDHSIIDTLHFHFCPNCGSYNGGDTE